MSNRTLNRAKKSSSDEWYTPYEVVEKEVEHYIPQFNGKSVLCNCNDGLSSRFSWYFILNFNRLQLKELTCIQYDDPKLIRITAVHSISEDNECNVEGYIKPLKSGDFLSEDGIKSLNECDIACTNPPFSKFKLLFDVLMEYKKKFLLISNHNATLYSKVFPHIKHNEVRIGYNTGYMKFLLPDSADEYDKIYPNGLKYKRLGTAVWLTNLDVNEKPFLQLTAKYNPQIHKKYDTYDAIHVPTVKDIPYNYDGLMGVPLTFLNSYNAKQFEIVGEANHGRDNEYDLFDPIIDGKNTFKRIIIKQVKS